MTEDDYTAMRHRMVETQIAARGVSDPRVLAAMKKVPRHRFIPSTLWDQAHGDYPLPIGEDQTISQPYIVALMTEMLELKDTDRVLEIGTGSGYQAAILAELAAQVFTIDRVASLLAQAERILTSLGYTNITTRVGDGTLGWPEEMPFEAIIVTAGAPQVPRPLTEQLALGGRLVIPVGDRWSQTLTCVRKTTEGLKFEYHGGCRFVRLIGEHGWQEAGVDVSQEGVAGLALTEEQGSRFKVRQSRSQPCIMSEIKPEPALTRLLGVRGSVGKVPTAQPRRDIWVPKVQLGNQTSNQTWKNLLRLGHLGFGEVGLDDPPGQGGGVFTAVAAVLHQDGYGHLGVVGRGVGHEPGVIFLAPGLLLFGIIPIDGDHLGRAGFAGHLDVGQAGGLGRAVVDHPHQGLPHRLQSGRAGPQAGLHLGLGPVENLPGRAFHLFHDIGFIDVAAVGNGRHHPGHLDGSGEIVALADGYRDRIAFAPGLMESRHFPGRGRRQARHLLVQIEAGGRAQAEAPAPLIDALNPQAPAHLVEIDVAGMHHGPVQVHGAVATPCASSERRDCPRAGRRCS